MTTEPSGEASASSNPPHGTPEASLGSVRGNQSINSAVDGSQSQESGTVAPNQQDVSQASIQQDTLEAKSGRVPEDSPEPKAVTSLLLREAPGALQVSRSNQNPLLDMVVKDAKTSHSDLTLQGHSLIEEERPQSEAGPGGRQELTPSSPGADTQPAENATGQPVSPAAQPTADAAGQPDTQAFGNTEATQEPVGSLQAVTPETKATVVPENLVESSDGLPAESFLLSPGSSTPPSPAPCPVAPGRRPLDSNLYMADEENNYMRSMTSLLGGGEGSISSLADILVWSDTAVGMATGFLATGHSSVTDLLQGTGPSLHSASSILGSASSAFSSGLAAGTGSALRSVTNMLETVERRTIEGIRSAVRFLTSHLTPHRAPAGPTCD
ncbi:testis-expressed protein 44 [Orycteropus afer afer]|uniref:Testis-expressed protein 44 n=1 Tax=Orycteropus afer afer TaxID=1230840 RepID=A0A8B7A7B2_ORYAF|nr:testis-expressed protein 44 [Orycteropus afer afer]